MDEQNRATPEVVRETLKSAVLALGIALGAIQDVLRDSGADQEVSEALHRCMVAAYVLTDKLSERYPDEPQKEGGDGHA